MLTTSLYCLAAVLVAAVLLWLVSVWQRNVNIVDIFWGLGFVSVAWISFGAHGFHPWPSRSLLAVVLTTIWGIRLAAYLAWRNHGKPEDHRYRAMRERSGDSFWLTSLIYVFGLQALLLWFISLPLQAASASPGPISWLHLPGGILWAAGLMFEALGDYQLMRFKADPSNQGKVFDQGLWRYTRHPNYFGDFLVWWGFYGIAVVAGGWWTLLSPVVMSLFLIRISGAALLERSLTPRVAGYANYVERTSAFFPMPPQAIRTYSDSQESGEAVEA